MKTLNDFCGEIIAQLYRLRRTNSQNYLICGITPAGKLITEEAVDYYTRFAPQDVREQISFRADTSVASVHERLAMLDALCTETSHATSKRVCENCGTD